ncbi:hypothetical protein [Paractinoplanes rishiriensis]|uniref:Uncharacterized protein n=1 Tax=Paractinoplanes rishiriensis TaxID=1050105 RepID=A0A919N0D8_9ACTN|nr:hypothetical protein [Actinoplanes rishiriensis]GIE99500.1 hypothetical protein Ari01nite_69650 [Actinoplanes rishiriensis]
MATSQTPHPHRRPVGDRAPSAPATADGDPATEPAPPAAPPRPSRRRRTTGDRRTTIDTRTQEAIQAAVDRLVTDAPPLSDETRERLAALLSTTTHRPGTNRRPAAQGSHAAKGEP